MRKKIHNIETIKPQRRSLRRKSTPQEVILWARLRNRRFGFKFHRQHSIDHYIADFYCAEKKLVIEIDGSQHKENEEYDAERTKYFENLNLKVLRFWNDEINNNLTGVLLKIEEYLRQ